MRRTNTILLCLILTLIVGIAYRVYATEVNGNEISAKRWNETEDRRWVWTLRAADTLTTSYVYTNECDIGGRDKPHEGFNDIGVLFDISRGSLTSFEYIIWTGTYVDTDLDRDPDTWLWTRECTETVAATQISDSLFNYSITLSGDVEYYKPLRIYGERVKLQVKGTGTATGSSCAVYLMGIY